MKGNAVRRGSVARYQGDRFQAVEPASPAVPGNPWFICTLWLAQHRIARAATLEELRPARDLLEWAAAHALPSGVLAEQIHPRSGLPLSVSPLAWSHAEYVITYLSYIEKYRSFTACPSAAAPMRARRPAAVRQAATPSPTPSQQAEAPALLAPVRWSKSGAGFEPATFGISFGTAKSVTIPTGARPSAGRAMTERTPPTREGGSW